MSEEDFGFPDPFDSESPVSPLYAPGFLDSPISDSDLGDFFPVFVIPGLEEARTMDDVVKAFFASKRATMLESSRGLFEKSEMPLVERALDFYIRANAQSWYYKNIANGENVLPPNLPVYYFEGHGSEGPEQGYTFQSRPHMPANTYLVASAQYDEYMYSDHVCEGLYKFLNTNPEYGNAFKTMSGEFDSKRKYVPGSSMPDLWYFPVNDIKTGSKSNAVRFSGLQKHTEMFSDGQFTKQEIAECKPFYIPIGRLTVPTICQIFQNSLYPTAFEVLQYFGNYRAESGDNGCVPTLTQVGKHFGKRVKDVMEEVGPGIYYFFLCRSCPRLPLSVYKQYQQEFPAGQTEPGFGRYEKSTMDKDRETLFESLDTLPGKGPVEKEREQIRTTKLIREASNKRLRDQTLSRGGGVRRRTTARRKSRSRSKSARRRKSPGRSALVPKSHRRK